MNPEGSKSGSRGLNPRQAGDTPGLFVETAHPGGMQAPDPFIAIQLKVWPLLLSGPSRA